MEKFWRFFRAADNAAWAVFIVAAYMVLVNLGGVSLWHDEGTNAIVAKNFVRFGSFTAWDGRNLFFGIQQGAAINSDFIVVSYPPLPIITSAAGLALFGENEFALRLPHALLGLLSLFFFWRLLRLDFPAHLRLRLFAFILFALSAQVILYMRQGRYYADAFCFSLASFYYYRLYLQNCRARFLSLAALLTVFNFLNHFAIGASVAVAVGAWHLSFFAKITTRKQWLAFAVAGVAVVAVCLSYLLWVGIVGGDEQLEYGADFYGRESWLERRLILLFYYFRDVVYLGWFPLWPALWFAGFYSFYLWTRRAKKQAKRKKKSGAKNAAKTLEEKKHGAVVQWTALAAWIIFFGSLVSVQTVHNTQLSDMRYLIAALPFLSLCLATCVERAWLWKKTAGGALLAVLLFSNLAGFPANYEGLFRRQKITFPLPLLAAEIHRPYKTAHGEVADYLRRHAKQDDTVYHPMWQDYSLLLYYLGDKLIFCCFLEEDGAKIPRQKVRALNLPLYKKDAAPDWIVQQSDAAIDEKKYDKVYETETYFYPTQRPEIEYRSFSPIKSPPKMAIYKRKS